MTLSPTWCSGHRSDKIVDVQKRARWPNHLWAGPPREQEQFKTQMNNSQIVSDPRIAMGKPVVVGTRITVELILEKLAAGETIEQIVKAHPRLTKEAVLAAIDFAAQALKADVLYPVTSHSQ